MSAFPGSFADKTSCRCYGVFEPNGKFAPHTIMRRPCGPNDVVISIKFAGICHSDIHQVREEWGKAGFPMVPGHEIGGFVAAIGNEVDTFSIGDPVGVGCLVDSCRSCSSCSQGFENYCISGNVGTYNSKYKYAHCLDCSSEPGSITYGGYSETIVVDKAYVLRIPRNLDLAGATPLLCAGITTFSPLKKFGLTAGMSFAVVGLGGLGHMGVKFGVAMGAHTTVISRGTAKKESAMLGLGAHAYLDSTDAAAMAAAAGTFDFVLDSVSATHDVNALLRLLRLDGKYVVVGAQPSNLEVSPFSIIVKRLTVAGSLIGGIAETQEMLDFCGEHGITCDIELLKVTDPADIDAAYDRIVAGDVKYRVVIDNSSLSV